MPGPTPPAAAERHAPQATTPAEPLRIGDLASRTDVTVEALRYYEKRGLLRPSGRLRSGYREYASNSVTLVRFIKRAQSLGFTLAEVEELVHLRERAWAGDATRRLRDAVVAKLDDIDRRARELHALRDELGNMIAACDAACPDPSELDESVAPPGGTANRPAPGDDATVLDCPLVEALEPDGISGEAVRSARTARP
jgi:DNA-binding transcriptional MerR regulator